jgi:hypothetical protein
LGKWCREDLWLKKERSVSLLHEEDLPLRNLNLPMKNTSPTSRSKIKHILKELFATRYGWFSLLLANLLWSMFWLPTLVLWFVSKNEVYLLISTSIYVFFAQPLVPMTWLIIPTTAYFILKKWLKK